MNLRPRSSVPTIPGYIVAMAAFVAFSPLAATAESVTTVLSTPANQRELRPLFASPLDGPCCGGIVDVAWWDDGAGLTLYAAGNISRAGSRPAHGLIRWDGVRWVSLTTRAIGPYSSFEGSTPSFYNFLLSDGQLLANGFRIYDAQGAEIRGIARWGGRHWETLPGTVLNNGGQVDEIYASQGKIYAKGPFTSFGGQPTNGHVIGSAGNWDSVGVELLNSSNETKLFHGEVIACETSGNTDVTPWKRWRNGVWQPLIGGPTTCGSAETFATEAGYYIFGFDPITGAPQSTMKWDGSLWSSMDVLVADSVMNLEEHEDGLVATHYSRGPGCCSRDFRISRWDGSSWQSFPSQGAAGAYGMAKYEGDLLFFGYEWREFVDSDGVGPAMLMRWDENAGMSRFESSRFGVGTMTEFEDGIAFGSYWRAVGNSAVGCVALFRNGTLNALGDGIPGCGEDEGSVNSLAAHQDSLFARMDFHPDSQRPSTYWRWTAEQWSPITTPPDGYGSFVANDNGLYLLGRGVFKWDGQNWQRLGNEIVVNGSSLFSFGGVIYTVGAIPGSTDWQLMKLIDGIWVEVATPGLDVSDAATFAGSLFIVSPVGDGMQRLMRFDGSNWLEVHRYAAGGFNASQMDSTEMGLVLMSEETWIFDESGTTLFPQCHARNSSLNRVAIEYQGDLMVIGIPNQYLNLICVLGQMAQSEVELAIHPERPQPGEVLTAVVEVRSASSAPQGVVGIDGLPAGSCTITELTPISATTSSGSCEITYTREMDVEFVATYFGYAISGGDGWHESISPPMVVPVSADIFSDSFELAAP